MRIVGGALRGRRLAPPPRHGVRPTADPVREALFNLLGSTVAGRPFVDLAAGTGAVGLEALSRGAEPVVLVERARAALRVIEANVERLGLADDPRLRIVAADAGAFLDRGEGPRPLGVVYLDPPWDAPVVPRWIGRLVRRGWLDGASLVVVEHRAGRCPELPGLDIAWQRRYGDTGLTAATLSATRDEQNETG
ncbi:MAG: 16S rRNA (guanine(966)-N(2))-methyltransferase RsmD [Acidobacteriota bacterium]